MPHLQLTWQVSMQLAAALAVLALLLRRFVTGRRGRPLAPAALQAAMLVGLYGLWGLVGQHAQGSAQGAQQRGLELWDLERRWHVVGEAAVQALVLPHGWLVQAANTYYVYGHVNVMIALLAWVWWRHRRDYPWVCAVVVVFTVVSSALQLLSVAPPRLLPGPLVVDTGLAYGQSVYGPADPGAVSQLAAMPSIHVGWALLAGLTVVLLGRTWRRWVALAHPVLMTLVVVVTGNHYWLDAAVAAGLLVAAAVPVLAARRVWERRPAAAQRSEPLTSTSMTGVPS